GASSPLATEPRTRAGATLSCSAKARAKPAARAPDEEWTSSGGGPTANQRPEDPTRTSDLLPARRPRAQSPDSGVDW
ncbi:MAG: hypothetical protein M4579_007210, partial [Chaenotheca gracillima]